MADVKASLAAHTHPRARRGARCEAPRGGGRPDCRVEAARRGAPASARARRWALRAPGSKLSAGDCRATDLFAEPKAPLEDIKSLSGSPGALAALASAARLAKLVADVAPPQEAAGAHALLLSAVQLAGNAALIRREAALAGDMARAWDASSAAAGALMLGAKARADIQTLLRPPHLQ